MMIHPSVLSTFANARFPVVRKYLRPSAVATLALLLLSCIALAPLNAASIEYGNFVGGTVMFTDVTESSEDPLPLYGDPSLAGDSLVFSPQQFAATSSNQVPPSKVTDGQLTFGVMALAGHTIQSISFDESGAFLVSGFAASNTDDTYVEATAVGHLTVMAIDGDDDIVPLVIPINLEIVFDPNVGPNVAANRWRFKTEGGATGSWSGSQFLDITDELIDAGRSVVFGATKILVNLDNILTAQSEPLGSARIDKKLFLEITTTGEIPEPASAALLGIALLGLVSGRWSDRRGR